MEVFDRFLSLRKKLQKIIWYIFFVNSLGAKSKESSIKPGKKIPMKKPKQLSFFKNQSTSFGGSLLQGKRKTKRPLSTKQPLHLILKSEFAKGSFRFTAHRSTIENIFSKLCKRYGIKLHDLAVNFDHIHMVISFNSIHSYKGWVRHLTSKIVKEISRRTKVQLKNFFTHRPYSRIVAWGRDLKGVLEYLVLNKMEVFGLRPVRKKGVFL